MPGFITCIVASSEGGFNPLNFSHSAVALWTIIIFLLALYPMIKFVFGPIAKALDAQDGKARQAVTDAEKARDEAQGMKREIEENLARIKEQEKELMTTARARAEEVGREIQLQAREEGDKQLERARRTIAQEESRVKAELRKEVVDLSIYAAGRVIGRSVQEEDHKGFVEDLVQGMSSGKDEGSGAS